MTLPQYHVASFSGGKDSTAMVLRMIELGEPLDEVVFCDTTAEFPAMIRHVEKVRKVIEAAGVKFTTLKNPLGFEYYLAQIEVPSRAAKGRIYQGPGYGWPTSKARWCTKSLKTRLVGDHLRHLNEEHEVIQYIGIAADEDYRLGRKQNQDPSHRHPLREWGWTEADAMAYCREKGYDWEGLYDIFDRVSCWLCPLQSYDELRKLRSLFPDLWAELLRLDALQWKASFAHGYSVRDFDRRFELEVKLTAAGHSIKNRAFFADLKRLLADEVTAEDIIKQREVEQ